MNERGFEIRLFTVDDDDVAAQSHNQKTSQFRTPELPVGTVQKRCYGCHHYMIGLRGRLRWAMEDPLSSRKEAFPSLSLHYCTTPPPKNLHLASLKLTAECL